MIDVYRIQTFTVPKNSHKINRDETWAITKNKSFKTTKQAEYYIREQSIKHTDFLIFAQDLSEKERDLFKDEFCFNNDQYLRYRRYFIGPPPLEAIKATLGKDGIRY